MLMSFALYVCFFSRPTAVNLADAALKLKQVIAKALAIATEPKSIFKVTRRFVVAKGFLCFLPDTLIWT